LVTSFQRADPAAEQPRSSSCIYTPIAEDGKVVDSKGNCPTADVSLALL
jgi:hypothetical protein